MGGADTVESLGPGDHACVTFSDPDERLDIVAGFVHAGLSVGHKVLCLTEALSAQRLSQELDDRDVPVTTPLRTGQLAIGGSDLWWSDGGTPTSAGMIAMLTAQLEQATGEGYPGLRVSADMVWATRPLAAIDQLLVFETDVAGLLADGRLTVICQYDRDSFDPVTLASATGAHPRSVAATAYHDDALLRVCRQSRPPGVRLAGEIDASHTDALTQAMTEALRLDRNIYLNLSSLRFIDATNASVIVRAALSLPEDRQMHVVCHGVVRRMLDLAGAGSVPTLRVQVGHDQP